MKNLLKLPVSGAGNNCFFITLAAAFIIDCKKDLATDGQKAFFQKALNKYLGESIDLEAVLSLDYDISSQLLGIASRELIGAEGNDAVDVDETLKAYPVLQEHNRIIYELQDDSILIIHNKGNEPIFAFTPADIDENIQAIPEDRTPVIVSIGLEDNHFSLMTTRENASLLPGVDIRDATVTVQHCEEISKHRSIVAETEGTFFDDAAKALFKDILRKQLPSQSHAGGASAPEATGGGSAPEATEPLAEGDSVPSQSHAGGESAPEEASDNAPLDSDWVMIDPSDHSEPSEPSEPSSDHDSQRDWSLSSVLTRVSVFFNFHNRDEPTEHKHDNHPPSQGMSR